MDFEFSEAQKMLRATVREFVDRELPIEFVRKWDADESMSWMPRQIHLKAVELGLTSCQLPNEYGGTGGDFVDEIIIIEEVSRRSPAAAFGLGGGMFVRLIEAHGNEKQKKEYLPKMAKAETGFCIGLTEPGGGTDLLGALRTTAVEDGDNFVVNGQKIYITGAHVAPYIMTLVITNKDAAKRHRAMSLLIIDLKSPGVEIRPLHKISMRGSGANEVFFTDVRVPKENLLGQLNNGFFQLITLLNPERIVCAATTVGLAQGAFELALDYAKTRTAFGKPIGQFQVLQHWLADMSIEIELARLMTYKAAWLFAKDQPCYFEAAAAKVCASEAAVKTTTNAMEIFAGAGVMAESDIQRYFRDARQFTFAPISNEMARNFIGELMGLPRSF